MNIKQLTFFTSLIFATLFSTFSNANGGAEDATITTLELDSERVVQVWNWEPASTATRGVILFSHGAASAPWKYQPLIGAWLAAGFSVHAPLHVDSTDHTQNAEFAGMASWKARLEDMRALSATVKQNSYIAAGHSYGALTALTLGGAQATIPEGFSPPLADAKVSAVLAFSPPPAFPGLISKEGYGELSAPALIQTGTLDIPFGNLGDWDSHLDAYNAAAQGGHRYALVLEGVDHYFGGLICRPELPGPKQLEALRSATELSLAVIAAHTENNALAQQQLADAIQDTGPVRLMTK